MKSLRPKKKPAVSSIRFGLRKRSGFARASKLAELEMKAEYGGWSRFDENVKPEEIA